jgi:uncharacterized membrane protein
VTLRKTAPRGNARVLAGITVLAAAAFSVVDILKFSSFQYGLDTAVVSNVLWRLAHGYDSVSALTGFAHLSDHPSVLLLLLVPVAAVAGPWLVQCLFVLQAASVASVGWFVWRYAKAKGLGSAVSLALYATTLLGLGSWFAATGEFHLLDVALGPAAATVANWQLGNRRRALLWAAVAASARIEMALVVIILGLVLWGKDGQRSAALVGIGGAMGVVIGLIGVLAGPGSVGVVAHLGHLGSTPGEVIGTILHHPVSALEPLGSSIMWASVFIWMASFGLLPVLAGARWLLPALPVVAIPMLGSWVAADAYYEHYWHIFVVFGAIAAAYGLSKLELSSRTSVVLLAAPAILMWVVFGPLNSSLPKDWRATPMARNPDLASVVRQVDAVASVTAPLSLTASLSLRPEVMFFPRPFSCSDTARLLPTLRGPESGEPPYWVIAPSDRQDGDERVWEVLRTAYTVAEEQDSYTLWRLRDEVPAVQAMVDCSVVAQ